MSNATWLLEKLAALSVLEVASDFSIKLFDVDSIICEDVSVDVSKADVVEIFELPSPGSVNVVSPASVIVDDSTKVVETDISLMDVSVPMEDDKDSLPSDTMMLDVSIKILIGVENRVLSEVFDESVALDNSDVVICNEVDDIFGSSDDIKRLEISVEANTLQSSDKVEAVGF